MIQVSGSAQQRRRDIEERGEAGGSGLVADFEADAAQPGGLLNNDGAFFQTSARIDFSQWAHVADFNRDGRSDLARVQVKVAF